MTGMAKLQGYECRFQNPAQLHPLENVRDGLENYILPLISQLFLSFSRDLFVDVVLPTKDLDHANDVHGLSDDLNPRIRLQQHPQ